MGAQRNRDMTNDLETSMRTMIAVAVAAVVAVGAPAQAQEMTEWGFAAGWHIMIDPGMGNGCLIQTIYDNGSVVRIGLDVTRNEGYVVVFDNNWGQIEDGAEYPVSFDLDGQKFDAVARGFHLGKVPGAGIRFSDRDFIYAIASKQVMTINGASGQIMAIELGGSAVALEAARMCQAEQG